MNKIMFHLNSLGKGGAERVVSLLANEFAKNGIDVIIATEWYSEEEYELDSRVRRIHAGLSDKEEGASRYAKQWFRIRNLRRVVMREKPDVLLSFCVKANYRAMMATVGTAIPVIVSVRNDPKIDYVGKVNGLMNKLFLNKAAGCVFQTEEAKEFFDEVLQKKSRIICNPVNEKYLQAERLQPKNKIVCVGRLVAQKNQMLLVNAFEKILEKYEDYHLYLYGDGSDDECKEELLQYVGSNDFLKEHIHFMGLSSTLEQDMADAAMFVLPSNYEGMPNALMEAMALGLPVISTDCPCGGSRYWIQHGRTGQLVPVRDVDAMVEAIEFYIQNPEEAENMGTQARKSLQEATLDKIYEQWKQYILSVLRK
ncbi:MAG: glycosyltransferase [Lachnospiraceae bacterium]|nr:glycosyltransferase [Lachnospiraceae bacterium]